MGDDRRKRNAEGLSTSASFKENADHGEFGVLSLFRNDTNKLLAGEGG